MTHEYRFVKPETPVTMRKVARAAGVAVSTVSKALRNDPTIPKAHCKKIQVLAERFGYRPNPLVAVLMAQLHHRLRRDDPHNLAWIDLWPDPGHKIMKDTAVLKGARERAAEMGYGVEVYFVARDQMSSERLRRVLTTRGQWGLIIPPVPESAMRFPFDLRGFTGVTIGTSLHEPVMHRVSPDHFQGCLLAFESLRAKGFRRIGLAVTSAMNQRVEGKWMGAYLACQQQLPKADRLSPLVTTANNPEISSGWLHEENPEVVLVAEKFRWQATDQSTPNQAQRPLIAWLVPQQSSKGLGWIDYRPAQLGRVAVEMVVAQIHRNERGSPIIPQSILISTVWKSRPR